MSQRTSNTIGTKGGGQINYDDDEYDDDDVDNDFYDDNDDYYVFSSSQRT